NGARLDQGCVVLATSGRSAVRGSRPLQGTPKIGHRRREADRWYVACSCAQVPTPPLPATGRQTGSAVGLTGVLLTAQAEAVETPRRYRTAAKALPTAQQQLARRKRRSKRWYKAARLITKQPQKVRRQRCDFHHQPTLALMRAYDGRYLEELQS